MAGFLFMACAQKQPTPPVPKPTQPKVAAVVQKPSLPEAPSPQTAPLIFSNLAPLQPQPAKMAPGLSVVYFKSFSARHLDALPKGAYAKEVGRAGKPISILNHEFGKGVVFGSREKRRIGMRMKGFIRFPGTGLFTLRAMANDGIRVYLAGQLILDDPKWHQHGNRYTIPAQVKVTQPGWYLLQVEYFQRKGTAALKLFWQPPGKNKYEIVPAKAFAHVADIKR